VPICAFIQNDSLQYLVFI